MGLGVCQALFLGGKQMQYKRGWGGFGSDIFQDIRRAWTVGGGAVAELWCFGAKVRMQVSGCWHFAVNVCRSKSASVWRHLSPARKIDSISKGDPF